MKNLAAGPKHNKLISPTAASLTKSSNRKTSSWFLPSRGRPVSIRPSLLAKRKPDAKPKSTMTIADNQFETNVKSSAARHRSVADLLAPLAKIAAHSPNLVANHDAHFEIGGATYELPRYLFVGPKG